MDKMSLYQMAEIYYPQAEAPMPPLSDDDIALAEKLAASIANALLES